MDGEAGDCHIQFKASLQSSSLFLLCSAAWRQYGPEQQNTLFHLCFYFVMHWPLIAKAKIIMIITMEQPSVSSFSYPGFPTCAGVVQCWTVFLIQLHNVSGFCLFVCLFTTMLWCCMKTAKECFNNMEPASCKSVNPVKAKPEGEELFGFLTGL